MDRSIYLVHLAFWAILGLGRLRGPPAPSGPAASEAVAPAGARMVVVAHGVAFFAMYYGIGQAVFGTGVPGLLPGQRLLGAAVILGGAALGAWSLRAFRSWRLAAQVDAGHELCTVGPFAWIRHPIYAALDLLALGSLLWIPTPIVGLGAALMLLIGDLRARAEEKVLLVAFGDRYRAYMGEVHRFVPGVY